MKEDLFEWLLKNADRIEKLPYFDDLGNVVKKSDSVAGCTLGEIVREDKIYQCKECGMNFCRKHVKFVDENPKIPLCNYKGKWLQKGCYKKHWKNYTDLDKREDLIRQIEELRQRKY